jgi:hypothetical protein
MPQKTLKHQRHNSPHIPPSKTEIFVSSTPGGLDNYVSEAYGGSTSARQIVERCKIVSVCDPGDSVMADNGFNFQDLFATANVQVNITTFFKKKNLMSG